MHAQEPRIHGAECSKRSFHRNNSVHKLYSHLLNANKEYELFLREMHQCMVAIEYIYTISVLVYIVTIVFLVYIVFLNQTNSSEAYRLFMNNLFSHIVLMALGLTTCARLPRTHQAMTHEYKSIQNSWTLLTARLPRVFCPVRCMIKVSSDKGD